MFAELVVFVLFFFQSTKPAFYVERNSKYLSSIQSRYKTWYSKWEVIATFESTTDGCMALVLGFEPSGYGVGFDRRSQSKRIHITLAMLASLIDEEFSIVDDDTDKTLVTKNVATLRVRVSQFTIGEFAQATVLAFFVDFTEICDSCKRCKTFAEDCYI
jgi:hypothetical protein